MNERPYALHGRTHKVRVPGVDHAIYITVTADDAGRPRELFANTKAAELVPWLTAVTRLATLALAHGAPADRVAEELRTVFDPRGGYHDTSGAMLSVVSHIGVLLERH